MATPDWKEKYRRRYEELKKAGKSFFPDIIFKDTVASVLILAALLIVVFLFPVPLEEIADPTDNTYNPRPDWYFLFLFQMLKLFPGSLEAVAAIILPTLVIVFLLLLPFIDRGAKRHPLDRPFLTLVGITALIIVGSLTYIGWKSPLLNPVVEKDATVLAGQRLYQNLRCSYCHSLNGRGGLFAPDLSTVGARRDASWLANHFRDPQAVSPGSLMPRLNLLPEEIDQMVAYMGTLGGSGPFTAKASKLFSENCAACHSLDGQGGDTGPDLTTIRTYRDKAHVYTYIRDPASLNSGTIMPGFQTVLTDSQIEDLARYLMSSQRKQKN